LAIYDGAEVILKPVFGALVDRVGPRPVLLGGLIGFAAASAAFVVAGDPGLLGVARFGQGAAAAAFSPAASTLVARLTPAGGHGRRFGSYGAWKGLGRPTQPPSSLSATGSSESTTTQTPLVHRYDQPRRLRRP